MNNQISNDVCFKYYRNIILLNDTRERERRHLSIEIFSRVLREMEIGKHVNEKNGGIGKPGEIINYKFVIRNLFDAKEEFRYHYLL